MEFEATSLYREVQQIINSGSKSVHFSYSAIIHVGNNDYRPLKILSIDSLEDFELNYSDETIITIAISGGLYSKRIYPFKDKVDITLIKIPLEEVADINNDAAIPQSERYTATLIDTGNPGIENNGSNIPTEEILDLTNIFEVSFQLVNKSLEQMRMISVGGIYRNTCAEDVIKSIMTNEMKKIVVEGSRKPIGVDMVVGSNPTKRTHILIPQGTKLVDVPEYIHSKCGGVYSSGFNYYLKNDHWYIYPCYDVTRFNRSGKKLTILNVPQNKFPTIERTFRKDGNNIVIMATGEVRFNDDSEVQQLNAGNGIRFADATKFMSGFATIAGNKASISRGINNTEVVSSKRANGNNNVQLSSNAITANPYVEYSKLARRQGSFLSFVWENSLPTIITPGIMIKVLYMAEDSIKEIYGVVLKTHHYTKAKGVGMIGSRYNTNSVISVFVEQVKK